MHRCERAGRSPINWSVPAAFLNFIDLVTDGQVNAVARSADGNTLYLGGDFTRVGPSTGGFAAIDSTTGTASASFPKVEGQVYASVSDGAGG